MKISRHDFILTIFIVTGGLGLFAWWSTQVQTLGHLNWKALPPDVPALIPLSNTPPTSGTQAIERPLFWESRRPLPLQAAPTTAAATPLELLGIVTEGEQRVALLRPQQGTPPLRVRRLRIGDNYNGATLQDIGTDQVTLKGANGVEVIKIKRGSQNPGFSNQPAKLSAPTSIEVTREKPLPIPQNRIDELKTKAAPQAQPPTPPKP